MSYFDDYTNMISEALATVDRDKVEEMTAKLVDLAKMGCPVLVCGNGGSAAIAEHMSCDHTKGVGMDTDLKPFFIPLQSNVSMLTAIANDIGYNEVFRQQIKMFPNKNAGVLAISSSGSSGNIFNALDIARFYKMPTMAMVGFDGGSVVGWKVADIVIHVKSNNYGVVEDCHQIIMHSMAQSIRLAHYAHDENYRPIKL
jgi:D-sedoheptulose 7-phosphate isomerase/D-glycero-D-manno-heptose 1,7-bisphosphate phosphatase